MRLLPRPLFAAFWLCASLVLGCLSLLTNRAADSTAGPTSLADLPDTINIHHQLKYCPLCHQMGAQGPIPSPVLFGSDYQVGCRCHYRTPGDLRHPTDAALPEAMRTKIPATFPLHEGKITCLSCHSFAVLCAIENNRSFALRGAPYADRSAFCFQCHEEQQFARLNPHRQLDASGKIIEEKCLFCHTQKPDETQATFSSIKLIGGLAMLCQGCHNVGDKHPAGQSHRGRPTLEHLVRMHALERQYGLVLPLDEEGKLTCITCHNPHEAGVIPKPLPGAKGADEKLRHRLPKVLCSECHWRPISGPTR